MSTVHQSLLAAAASQEEFPCWARAGTGVVLALIAWAAFVGGRVAVRQYRDGRVRAANVTGVLCVVGVAVAVTAFSVGIGAAF